MKGEDSKHEIASEEAEVVNHIYREYLKVGSTICIVHELKRDGIKNGACSKNGITLMILTGCIDEKSAYKSFDFKLIVLIVSFGVISTSVSDSGGGDLIAQWFADTVGSDANPGVIAAFLFLLCTLITHFMSNIVTVMLMGPIAYSIAAGLGVNPYAMVMITIIACTAVMQRRLVRRTLPC